GAGKTGASPLSHESTARARGPRGASQWEYGRGEWLPARISQSTALALGPAVGERDNGSARGGSQRDVEEQSRKQAIEIRALFGFERLVQPDVPRVHRVHGGDESVAVDAVARGFVAVHAAPGEIVDGRHPVRTRAERERPVLLAFP